MSAFVPPALRAPAPLRVALLVAVLVAADLGWAGRVAIARMTAVEAVAAAFATEVLDAPTGLGATATLGLIVSLTWTPTVDARATGYIVLRATTSGGPYTQLGTVTPRSATAYTDLPVVPGTYYYVLRSYYGPWTSADSNEASVFAL